MGRDTRYHRHAARPADKTIFHFSLTRAGLADTRPGKQLIIISSLVQTKMAA